MQRKPHRHRIRSSIRILTRKDSKLLYSHKLTRTEEV